MAQAVPNPPHDRKRVKVYELRNNDWYDRGTGFAIAAGSLDNGENEPRIMVEAEEGPERLLLETQISRQGGFAKQQDTLIIWTEPTDGIDMALSFQEAEGCSAIWKFIANIQQQLAMLAGPDDALSEEIHTETWRGLVNLPEPGLSNLKEIEDEMRRLSNTQLGREALGKFVMAEDYISKLTPLVQDAEDFESLIDLHRLCNIMKTLILLNDNDIIEYAVSDAVILGVVGALEYDPDFPSHKANHRQWLGDKSRYKEVVPIKDPIIQRKIHHTYRLQYLKDVVLARILDDPTFSILNSLIFYYQLDIVQHIQTDADFLKDLFAIFNSPTADGRQKKDAVLFIQQCCSIAKNLQPSARNVLYNNFINQGLLSVITFALKHDDVAVRVGATDVLVSVIDHDPQMIRQTIYRQMNEGQAPLTESLIDLLLVEVDLGVKAQIADAIKVLLDSSPQPLQQEGAPKAAVEIAMRMRSDPQQEVFLSKFYEGVTAKRLFEPLVTLRGQRTVQFSIQQISLFEHLIEILWFFIRQHQHRSKYFVLSESLGQRVAQLLSCPEKHLKLTALKFFRHLVGLNDEFYNQQIINDRLFEPILDMIKENISRDNLLNSACLDFFEYFRVQGSLAMVTHLVENYRDKLVSLSSIDTFKDLVAKYDNRKSWTVPGKKSSSPGPAQEVGEVSTAKYWQGLKDLDAAEEEYFNTSEDELAAPVKESANGPSRPTKPLVDYDSDEMDSEDDRLEEMVKFGDTSDTVQVALDGADKSNDTEPKVDAVRPPERLSEKRRREDEEDDELMKLSQSSKRRSSTSSTESGASLRSNGKRKFAAAAKDAISSATKKISISLGSSLKQTEGRNVHAEK